LRGRGNDVVRHCVAGMLQPEICPSFDGILDSVKRVGMMSGQYCSPSQQFSHADPDQRRLEKMGVDYVHAVPTNDSYQSTTSAGGSASLGTIQTIHRYSTLSQFRSEFPFTGRCDHCEFDRPTIAVIHKIVQEVIC